METPDIVSFKATTKISQTETAIAWQVQELASEIWAKKQQNVYVLKKVVELLIFATPRNLMSSVNVVIFEIFINF